MRSSSTFDSCIILLASSLAATSPLTTGLSTNPYPSGFPKSGVTDCVNSTLPNTTPHDLCQHRRCHRQPQPRNKHQPKHHPLPPRPVPLIVQQPPSPRQKPTPPLRTDPKKPVEEPAQTLHVPPHEKLPPNTAKLRCAVSSGVHTAPYPSAAMRSGDDPAAIPSRTARDRSVAPMRPGRGRRRWRGGPRRLDHRIRRSADRGRGGVHPWVYSSTPPPQWIVRLFQDARDVESSGLCTRQS